MFSSVSALPKEIPKRCHKRHGEMKGKTIMKTKAKLTLAISVLSAAVLAAGVTSTFAWFTTQSKVTFDAATLTVDTLSDIKISAKKLAYVPDTDYSAPGASYTDNGSALGVVSSFDGRSFFAPRDLRDDNASYAASDMEEVTTKSVWEGAHSSSPSSVYYGNTHVGYMKYSIKVTADHETGNGRKLKITLKTPTITDTAGNDLQASYRVAFGDVTNDADADLKIYRHTSSAHAGYKTKSATDTVAAGDVGALSSNVVIDASSHKTQANTGINAEFLLSIWVEGLDTHATNVLFGKQISFGIDFDLVTYVPA